MLFSFLVVPGPVPEQSDASRSRKRECVIEFALRQDRRGSAAAPPSRRQFGENA
jgi:hypothetical protein